MAYETADGGVLLGLRAGYAFDLYSDTWHWPMPHIRFVAGGYGIGQ